VALLWLTNTGTDFEAMGIIGVGGNASGSTPSSSGAPGLAGIGGNSNGNSSFGGYGVLGYGGQSVGFGDGGGDGGIFVGGAGSANTLAYAGNGIYAAPGGTGATSAIYGLAAYLDGNVTVNGNLAKNGGSFLIDHPLDPANKYLYHSFVESPDMMNIYNGNVTTDSSGFAIVTLPEWFEALNRDFRYQLTTIGQFAQATVLSEIQHNSFTIKTDKPGVKVSWTVTGIRQDAWANAHRIPLEVDKAQPDQGHYLHPELFGHAGEPSISQTHHPIPEVSRHP
jgi:hypothetical protein